MTKPYVSVEAALAAIRRGYWNAKLIVGDNNYQCYLYPNHTDPNSETEYLAMEGSVISLQDAMHKAVLAHLGRPVIYTKGGTDIDAALRLAAEAFFGNLPPDPVPVVMFTDGEPYQER